MLLSPKLITAISAKLNKKVFQCILYIFLKIEMSDYQQIIPSDFCVVTRGVLLIKYNKNVSNRISRKFLPISFKAAISSYVPKLAS